MRQQDNKGGITVFLAIIFMSVLLLTGLLADAARIAVADRKVQSSLNTAVRSALAGYDEELVGGYGIFGLDTGSDKSGVRQEVIKYLEANLQERHEDFKFIDYELKTEGVEVTGMGNLLSNDIFKRQIVEYMKYKGPIFVTLNVIDSFKSANMGSKIDFSVKEKNAREAGEKVKESMSELGNTVGKIGKSLGKTTVKEVKDTIVKKVKDDPEGAIDDLKGMLDSCKEAKEKVNSIKDKVEEYGKVKEEADSVAREAGATPTESEFGNANEDLKKIEGVLDTNTKSLDNAVGELKTKKQEYDTLKKELEDLKSQKAGESEIAKKQAQIDKKQSEISDVVSNTRLDEPEGISGSGAGNQDITEPHQKDDEDTKGFFEKLKKEFSEKLMINTIENSWLISREEFEGAASADSQKFRNMSESIGNLEDEEVAEEQNKNILSFIKGFFEMLEGAAANAVENIYITEYIMDKYTFVTSQTERGHFFKRGEVEYILWGMDTEGKNVLAVMGQTWFLRFAIDTVDYFFTSKIPHPGARLVWALVEGLTRSFIDMYKMYNGDRISVCPSADKLAAAPKLRYSDHLRIFLLFIPENTKLDRMRQLIQINITQDENSKNKDFRLKNCNTIINAKAEVSINLWILPLFQADKFGLQQFKGGRYVIKKETTIGY